jgi:inorganic pyrophosphatase
MLRNSHLIAFFKSDKTDPILKQMGSGLVKIPADSQAVLVRILCVPGLLDSEERDTIVETWISIDKSRRCKIPDACNVQQHCCENLKSRKYHYAF